MRFGQDGAPLLTPVFRKTVKGRPVLRVTIPLNCQLPKSALPIPPFAHRCPVPKGSSQT